MHSVSPGRVYLQGVSELEGHFRQVTHRLLAVAMLAVAVAADIRESVKPAELELEMTRHVSCDCSLWSV